MYFTCVCGERITYYTLLGRHANGHVYRTARWDFSVNKQAHAGEMAFPDVTVTSGATQFAVNEQLSSAFT
jgi:hypothetical protein